MKTVIEYKILQSGDSERVESKVNSHLADGWQLHGHLLMAIDGEQIWFAQAMVLEEDDDERG